MTLVYEMMLFDARRMVLDGQRDFGGDRFVIGL
jgi:hypothetical protein